MSADFIALGQAILTAAWGLFSVPVPGLGLTVGELSIGVALLSVSLLVAKVFFGLGGHGETPRTGSTNNPKISKERSRDEF